MTVLLTFFRYGIFLSIILSLSACVSIGGYSKNATEAAQYNAQLGASYLRRGELEQARKKLERALENDASNPLANVTYAQLQHRVGNHASASKHFKQAIKLEKDDADLAKHRNAYGIYLCQTGSPDAALQEFSKAADNPYYKTPEFALDNAGLCMLDVKQLPEAENYLRKALRINPKFGNAYLHMAELMHRQGRLTVADAYYQRYLAYGPDTAESLLLGLKLKRDAGDRRGAEKYASRLLNEFPESAEAGEYLSRTPQ
ncbi:MAG: type IV pilus biogenesis/stability protein PilW [Granulosicoccus sp.]